MIEQQNDKLNNNRANGEARCFLCLKNTLEEYSFQFEDLCHFIISKKIYCKRDISKKKNEKELSENLYNSLKNESKKLIKPCKCDLNVHIQCLIQYCIIHLNITCDECNYDYCFNFKELNENSNSFCFYISMILWLILHIILLSGTIIFLLIKIIPKKYDCYNYIIAFVLLLFNALLFYGNYLNYKPNQFLHKNIYPSFINFSNQKKTEEEYTLFGCFLQRVLKTSMLEIVEKRINNKLFINSTLAPEKELNDFINMNNNEIFDSNNEELKEKINEEELEDKFHGAQIIKSSLVQIEGINLTENETLINNNDNNNINSNDIINDNVNNKKIKFLPKSKTKNAHMRFSHNIPRKSDHKIYVKSHFEKIYEEGSKRQNTNVDNINSSKGNLIEEILNFDVKKSDSNGKYSNENNEKPTIEQQEFQKLTLGKNNNEEKDNKDDNNNNNDNINFNNNETVEK